MTWDTPFNQFKQNFPLDNTLVASARNEFFDQFNKLGWPTKKLEAWKYTSLTTFKAIPWTSNPANELTLTHEQMQQISKNLPSEFVNFVFVNGFLNKTLSDDLTDDIFIREIESEDLEKVEQHPEAHWLNLSRSFLHKKIVIKLGSHKALQKPIQLVYVQSSEAAVFSSEKIEIILDKNSEAKVLVHTMSFVNSTGDALNLTIDAQVGEQARLQIYQIQNEDSASFHFSQNTVKLASAAQFQNQVLTMGPGQSRNYLEIQFNGEYAQADVLGTTVLSDTQVSDNYTFIHHKKGTNTSNQHYKSLLSGGSESSFRGRVRIEPHAQKANSEQLNNNLLLTKDAKANSVPQLEIYADDVKAGHGSTVGQLSQDEIFYFLSRGISMAKAVRLLAFGFAQESIFKIENSEIKNFVTNLLKEKLERMIKND